MSRRVPLGLLLPAGCLLSGLTSGCSGNNGNTSPTVPIASTSGADAEPTDVGKLPAYPSSTCLAIRQLASDDCAPFNHYPPDMLESCAAEAGLRIGGIAQCVHRESCDEVHACFADVERNGAPPYDGPTTTCEAGPDEGNVPVGVPQATFDQRYGASDKTYADSPSTLARPIQVCGVPAQLDYLTKVTCQSGGLAFTDRTQAHDARRVNVGPGGACDRIIDLYDVACPERAYEVFIDAYYCPEAS